MENKDEIKGEDKDKMKKIKIILSFCGLFLLFAVYAESTVRTQVVRTSPQRERNTGIIPEARSLRDWQRVRAQVREGVDRRNRQREMYERIPDRMRRDQQETKGERYDTADKIEKDSRDMKQKKEQAEPRWITGENPDGTKWHQYSGRFDIYKNWIKRKLKELGLLDKWKGESFEELFRKYSRTNFELSFNRKSTVYFGNNPTTQTTEFQFSLTDPADNFEEYIQTRSRQWIWDSINNKESEIVQHTLTDEMSWAGRYYGTPGRTEQGRQMLYSRQRIWDITRNTYSEVTQENVYEGNFHMPIKTIRKIQESGYDSDGKHYQRSYQITRENIEWAWVRSGDPEIGGGYETKSFDQTLIDNSTPDKKTFSRHEFTYTADGLPESQLIVSRETGPGLDHTSVAIEKYLGYHKDNSLKEGLSLNMTGSFADFNTAIREGRTLQGMLNADRLKSQLEYYLGRQLDLSNPNDLKTYTAYISKAAGLVSEGNILDKALELLLNAEGWDDFEGMMGRRINLSRSEKKYNDKGFLAWEREVIAVRGEDADGTLLDFSQEVEKSYTAFTPFGQPTEITQVIRSEAAPDVETTLKISLRYNELGQVYYQKTETREKGINGKNLDKHTVSIKENIRYNGLGQEIAYTEKEEEYDTNGNLIGNRFSEVKNITYNQDGLQTGYDMLTTIRGTDTYDGTSFEIITETQVRNIEYNDLGIRASWREMTVDTSRSPGLITEKVYRVKATDEFGRIAKIDILERSYGTDPDGTVLDSERTITRKIIYNSLGQEAEAVEIVLEKAKTTTSLIKYTYDQYGRLSRELREVHVSGEDAGVVLDYTYTIVRDDFEYNNAGLVQGYRSVIWNEASPDMEITQEVSLGYNALGQVDYQKTETWENSIGDGALSKHTLTIKDNITYNELGLETAYTEKEEEYDTNGNLIGNRQSKVKNITYNQDGLQTGYDMLTTIRGTDTHDGTSFEIITETQVRNIEYNQLGIRISWDETSIDLSRSPGLTTERTYRVTGIDQFGRITELKIYERSYGEAFDGTVLDTERAITRQITYNSFGQEEEVVEIVEEGARTTTSTIVFRYDQYGRLIREERDVYIIGEEDGVELDYTYRIVRDNFEYNAAGLVQHYTSEIWNESSPDLEITQKVWLGYNEAGQVDYQKTESWEIGVTVDRDRYGEPTGEDKDVNRHLITIKHGIQYNELGLETYYITDVKEYEDGDLIRDVVETTSGIKYDSKGRLTEYTTHKTGKEKVMDEESERYGQWQNVVINTRTYNITYIDGLNLRKSWETFITGTVDGQAFQDSWNRYNVLEFDRYGQIVDIDVQGDGVDGEGAQGDGSGNAHAQGLGSQDSGYQTPGRARTITTGVMSPAAGRTRRVTAKASIRQRIGLLRDEESSITDEEEKKIEEKEEISPADAEEL